MYNFIIKSFFFIFIGLLFSACDNKTDKVEKTELAESKIKETTELKKSDQTETKSQNINQSRRYEIKPDDMVLGNKDAEVILVEHFSMTCPSCSYYHKKVFPELKQKYIDTGKIAYVTREVIANKQDLDATILARCSDNIDNYYKFIHVLLEQQGNWAFNKNYREILTNIAGLGGISPEQYAKCLNDESISETVIENTRFVATEPTFIGTPTFIINDKHFTKPFTMENLSNAIDQALENVKEKTNN